MQSSVSHDAALQPEGRSTEMVAQGAKFASCWDRGDSNSVYAFLQLQRVTPFLGSA